MSTACLFCRILSGEVPSTVIWDTADAVSFLDHRPLFPGHVLVVPRAHYETLMDLPQDLLGPLWAHAQVIAKAMEEGLHADGSFVAMNNRVSQSVPHMHIHVVPRRRKDGLKGFFWPRHGYQSPEEMATVQQTLRETIGRIERGEHQ